MTVYLSTYKYNEKNERKCKIHILNFQAGGTLE